nr:MAG TPA: hypothetical protein [Caudoviricetes sp.]
MLQNSIYPRITYFHLHLFYIVLYCHPNRN